MKNVIVITGASSGFGALAARALARAGSGRRPIFKVGENVRISVRYPLGHYRVPRCIPAQVSE